MQAYPRLSRSVFIVLLASALATGCDVNAALEEVIEARHLSSDMVVQFTKAADASNLAVMADTDEASAAFANDARERTAAVEKDAASLKLLLDALRFTEELRLLEEFRSRFTEYQVIDRRITDLAGENTNLKAQRLSFGAAQDAVDAFSRSLAAVVQPGDSREAWRIRALVSQVVSQAREIQAMQAPHIGEADEAAMTLIESRMSAAEAAARRDLRTLASFVQPGERPKLQAAKADLDRLVEVNRQLVSLSRRNTNVRSLALALNQKRTLVAACEESLHALQGELAKRGYVSSRQWF